MRIHCPNCKTVVLSRRNPICGTCLAPLPPEILFTPDQLHKVEEAERERDRQRKLREEQREIEAKRIASFDGGGGPGPMG